MEPFQFFLLAYELLDIIDSLLFDLLTNVLQAIKGQLKHFSKVSLVLFRIDPKDIIDQLPDN